MVSKLSGSAGPRGNHGLTMPQHEQLRRTPKKENRSQGAVLLHSCAHFIVLLSMSVARDDGSVGRPMLPVYERVFHQVVRILDCLFRDRHVLDVVDDPTTGGGEVEITRH